MIPCSTGASFFPWIELVIIDWGEKRAELDVGKITQEEYEGWKDSCSCSPWKPAQVR